MKDKPAKKSKNSAKANKSADAKINKMPIAKANKSSISKGKGFSPAPTDERESHTLLGQVLVELGYITIYQLDEALQIQRNEFEVEAKPLGQVLLELGYCSPNQLIRAIQVQSDYRKAIARAHST